MFTSPEPDTIGPKGSATPATATGRASRGDQAKPQGGQVPVAGTPEAYEARLGRIRGQLFMTQIAEAVWNDVLSEADRSRLGSSLSAVVEELQTWNAAALYEKAKRVSRHRATLAVARALEMIPFHEYRTLNRYVAEKEGRPPRGPQKGLEVGATAILAKVQNARTKCQLVVVHGGTVCGVFWRDTLYARHWDRRPKSWMFLLKLAVACERGTRYGPSDFGEDDTRRTMSSKKYNLHKLRCVPKDLVDHIQVTHGPCDQVYLDLPKGSVRVLEVGDNFVNADELVL